MQIKLTNLILDYPEYVNLWDYTKLSINPNINISLVKSMRGKNWYMYYLSSNSGITYEDVIYSGSLNWDWSGFSRNKNFTWNLINQELHKKDHKLQWAGISRNPNITNEIVLRNSMLSWNYYSMSLNPSITFDLVEELCGKYWDYDNLCLNPNITSDWLNNNYNDINWVNLSKNPGVELEFIQKNISQNWHWSFLSRNPNLTWEFIRRNINKPWNWYYISAHNCINWDVISNEKEYLGRFNMLGLSTNKNITWNIAINNANPLKSGENWNANYYMGYNDNITPELIFQNQNPVNTFINKWNFKQLSKNHKISVEFVYHNIDKNWDFSALSSNLYNKHI